MTKRNSPPGPLSPQEVQLIDELREHPDLRERFQTILRISSNAEDFFHMSEYLGEASRTCRKQAPDPWRRTQQKRLKGGAVEKVIEALTEQLEPAQTPDEIAPVRKAHRYLSNRVD